MPNAHKGIRNQGLSNAPYQSPRDSPTRAVPKIANSTQTATATNNGPILIELMNDLPLKHICPSRRGDQVVLLEGSRSFSPFFGHLFLLWWCLLAVPTALRWAMVSRCRARPRPP